MAFIFRQDIFRLKNLVNNILKRNGSNRVNVQRPKEPHTERQKYLLLTRPLFEPHPDALLPLSERCQLKNEEIKPPPLMKNPYVRILSQTVYNLFNDAKMVLIFHANSMNSDEHFHNQVLFHRNQMQYKKYFKGIMTAALTDTKFHNVVKLFESEAVFVVSQEIKITETLKLLKKMPNITLLAAIVDNRILSYAEVVKYSSLGDLTNVRAELVSTLNTAAQNLISYSNQHQQTLNLHLTQYIETLKEQSKTDPVPHCDSPKSDISSSILGENLLKANASEEEASVSSSDSSSSDSESDSDTEDKKK